ncbi:MAG: hypothetical protein DHS20C14_05470 [Phycisphaeraceae bacterium]|nr:MAG: hypothetical protein DHS20C14_05470 [Phycisphaeraceae bacterium]
MTARQTHHDTHTPGVGPAAAAVAPGPVHPGEPGWEDRLMALVSRLSRLCADLDAMSNRQSALIASDEVDALLDLLRERQGVVDSIAAVAGELDPVVRGWDALCATLDATTRDRVREQLDEIEAMGRRIGERDAEHRRTLETQRNALADRIAGVGRARAAMNAYGPGSGPRSPRYQDREG